MFLPDMRLRFILLFSRALSDPESQNNRLYKMLFHFFHSCFTLIRPDNFLKGKQVRIPVVRLQPDKYITKHIGKHCINLSQSK